MVTQHGEADDADIVELLNVWSDISVNLMQTQQRVLTHWNCTRYREIRNTHVLVT